MTRKFQEFRLSSNLVRNNYIRKLTYIVRGLMMLINTWKRICKLYKLRVEILVHNASPGVSSSILGRISIYIFCLFYWLIWWYLRQLSFLTNFSNSRNGPHSISCKSHKVSKKVCNILLTWGTIREGDETHYRVHLILPQWYSPDLPRSWKWR